MIPAEKKTPEQHSRRRFYIGGLLAVWLGLVGLQWRIFAPGAVGSSLEAMSAFALVNLNILILLLLLFLTFRNLAKLTLERRKGVLGSRLKTRLVLAFLATTVIPAVSLFLVSAGFLTRSIDGWFSTRVEKALENSMDVARSYYNAEKQATIHSARIIAERANSVRSQGEGSGETIPGVLETMRRRQRMEQVILIDSGGKVTGAVSTEMIEPPGADVGADQIKSAFEGTEGDLLITRGGRDFVRAVVPVAGSVKEKPYAVLVADRAISMSSMGKLEEITKGFEEYRQVQHNLLSIKASYIFPLLLMTLLVMFAATWFAFHLAKTITEPIGLLADATQRVAGGDLDFQLDEVGHDEISTLVGSFNLMTRDLKTSREKIETAGKSLALTNSELESWRKYMQAVMDTISAGVVGTNANGVITTMNPAAREMLALDEDAVGRHFRKVLNDEMSGLMDEVSGHNPRVDDTLRQQVVLPGDGMSRSVMLNLTALRDETGRISGTVMVLNDLTDLVKAERAHAWREVARRVAHEIKNPLTPIQLSAQRLRRRYGALLETADGEILDEATRTIVTQVDGLKQLVNEFSRFAKMPESRQVPAQLNPIVEDAVALYRPAHSGVTFDISLDPALPVLFIDPEQIKRALVNLLENAVNALAETPDAKVGVVTENDPERQVVRIVVADNGPGLSPAAREHLFEPYFSTKKGGTGLGLAIVKSIVSDHKGYIRALDQKPHGTRFVIELVSSGGLA